MDGEQEAIAEVEQEAPAIETEMEADEPVNLDETGDEPEVEDNAENAETEESDEDDLEEFEWNGRKVKGPKGLKEGLMMQADYTRKTQEVANTRKELEARAQRLEQQ